MSKYSVTTPVSLGQIVDSFDLNCLVKPSGYCASFKSDLQLFVDDYCKNKINYATLDKKCLEASSNQTLIQAIINKLNCAEAPSVVSGNPSIDISNINFCSSDSWTCPDCFSCDDCLIPKDAQGNPIINYTIKDLFQNYIRRINALQKVICTQETALEAQQVQINSLLNRVTLIENNCCNTTLVSSIQALTSRINSVDAQVQTHQTDIEDIQTNCC